MITNEKLIGLGLFKLKDIGEQQHLLKYLNECMSIFEAVCIILTLHGLEISQYEFKGVNESYSAFLLSTLLLYTTCCMNLPL